MRRALASLLLSVFSFSLIGEILSVSMEPDLPACCRRGGQHHCAMSVMERNGPSSGPSMKAHVEKCPWFPKGGAVLRHSGVALVASGMITAVSFVQQKTVARPDVVRGISVGNSHFDRGPPQFLS